MAQVAKKKYNPDEDDDDIGGGGGVMMYDPDKGPSADQFKRAKISHLVDVKGRSNYDIAKAICNFYDKLYNDTDTVCIITDTERAHPAVAAWAKGAFQRMEKDMLGKYIYIYRATRHEKQSSFKTFKPNPDLYEKTAKEYGRAYMDKKVELTADELDKQFNGGNHIVRCSHNKFDVYCRFSDNMKCEFKLQKYDLWFVVWRR